MEKQKVMLTVGVVLVLLGVFTIIFLGREQLAGKAFAVEQDYVAKWDFEETSGTAVKDDNGRYTGLFVGTELKRINVRERTSDPRRALDFPGVAGNGIEVKDANGEMPAGLRITNALTVSAWVKPARTPVDEMTIVDGEGWRLYGKSDGKIYFTVGSESAISYIFFPNSLNEWVQVAGVRGSDGILYLYINNILIDISGSDASNPDPSLPPNYGTIPHLIIGASLGTDNVLSKNLWEGGIDDVRIYDRALITNRVVDGVTVNEIAELFNAGRTADCFNKYCPKPLDEEALPDSITDSKYDVSGTLNDFDNVEKTPAVAGTDTVNLADTTATDIHLLHQPSFTNTFPKTFAHNNKNYEVVIAEQNQFEATAQLQVKSLASGQTLGTLGLSATQEDPLNLTSPQVALNLDTSTAEPEAYLQSFGYFDEGKVLHVLTGVTPLMNFDVATPWTASLLSGNQQQFLFDKELHTAQGSATGDGNFFLSIDGEEYLFTTAGDTKTHYFDGAKSKGVNITLLKLSSGIAIFSFNRIAAGLQETYEEVITQTDFVTVGGRVLRICANDDPNAINSVKVCEGINQLFSLSSLSNFEEDANFPNVLFLFEPPASGQQKSVRVFHLFTLPQGTTQNFAFHFSNNLLQKKRLALKMDTQYYLLEMADKSKPYFELTNLKLTHLSDPAKSVYTALGDQEKVKFNLPFQQQINLLLDTTTLLQYQIERTSSALPEIVNIVNQLQASISSYGAVKVRDLNADLTEKDSAVATVSLDTTDTSAVLGTMKINYGSTPTPLWLTSNVPTVLGTATLNDPDANGAQVLAYYNKDKVTSGGTVDLPQYTKYADLYLLYDLSTTAKNHRFTDTEFIIPLLKGNKLAFAVDGKFYLLSVAKPWTGVVTGGFNPEELRLTKLPQLTGDLPISAQVSDDGMDITFVLGDGENVQLTITTSTSTITFERKNTALGLAAVAKEINVMKDFKTILTSSSPVNLLNSVGTVVVSPRDTASSADQMIIEYPSRGSADADGNCIPLATGTIPCRSLVVLSDIDQDDAPYIIGEVTRTGLATTFTDGSTISKGHVLVIYNDWTSSLGVFTKSADVYLLYDLDEGEKTRPFNDEEFILPLVEREQQIALRYKGSFYLLSYSGTLSQGFRYSRLRLKPLLGGTTISPTTMENGVQFSVSGGTLLIHFDTLNRKITFGGALQLSPGQLPGSRAFNPFAEYQTELPPASSFPGSDNVLSIGDTEMYNCDNDEAGKFVDQVCVRGTLYPEDDPKEHTLFKEKSDLFTYQYRDADNEVQSRNVMVTYREKSGDYKRITVQHLWPLEKPATDVDYRAFKVDWKQFSDNLKNGRYPVIALTVNGIPADYLEVRGTEVLDTLTLKSLVTGKEYLQKKVVTLGETGKELYLAVDEKTLKFSQIFEGSTKTFNLNIEWQFPLLVSTAGVEQLLPAGGLEFTPSLGAATYTLTGESSIASNDENLATLSLADNTGGIIFQSIVPEGGRVSALLPNGEVVVLQAVSTSGGVTVRIQK